MIPVVRKALPLSLSPWPGRLPRVLTLVLLAFLLAGCSAGFSSRRMVSDLPPLQTEQGTIAVADVADRVPTPDLLSVDPQMQALRIDPLERSAMNNLAVLYNIEGRPE